MTHAADYGLKADNVSFDVKKVVERSRGVAKQLNQGVGYLLKKNKVDVIDGWAKLAGGKEGARKLTVEKDGKKIADVTGKNVILAT
ncbi:unnamed protein product, partial [Laminaria digitata]